MSDTINESAYDLLGDQLSSVTRQTKRHLYVVTTICLFIAYTGIIPDEASIFGFKFPNLTEGVINFGIFFIGLFSLISFVIHLTSDFYRYRHLRDIYNHSVATEYDNSIHTDPDEARENSFGADEFAEMTGYNSYQLPRHLIKYLVPIKFFFDFVFPVIFGSIGMIYFGTGLLR